MCDFESWSEKKRSEWHAGVKPAAASYLPVFKTHMGDIFKYLCYVTAKHCSCYFMDVGFYANPGWRGWVLFLTACVGRAGPAGPVWDRPGPTRGLRGCLGYGFMFSLGTITTNSFLGVL